MSTPVERIEQALKARYNVSELPDQLASAVASARDGHPELLQALMEGREMYRWESEAREALSELVAVPADDDEGLSALTIAQLRVLAEERGVDIPVGPKAAIVEALESAEAEAAEESEGEAEVEEDDA